LTTLDITPVLPLCLIATVLLRNCGLRPSNATMASVDHGRNGATLLMMKIELLYFDGCPGHEAFLPRLRQLLARAGVDMGVQQRQVEDEATARSERFLGSPTLRVDGVDVEPGAGDRTDYGLKCRLYRTEAGLRGAPPNRWVLDALQLAGHPGLSAPSRPVRG
jgi:hypothetical protein